MVAVFDWSDVTGTNDPSVIITDPATGNTIDASLTSSAGWNEFNAPGFGTTGFNWATGASDTNPNVATVDFGQNVQDAEFVIMDIDSNQTSFSDEVTIIGLDANGNVVPLTVTDTEAYHSVVVNPDGSTTITATGNASGAFNGVGDPDSVTISFDGPVQSIQIIQTAGSTINSGAIGWADISFTIPCFTEGTLVETPSGRQAIETLAPGDKVITKDSGVQVVKWIGKRSLDQIDLRVRPNFRPVRIKAHSMGQNSPERDLLVSPQHRILLGNWSIELYFGINEVLAPAKGLVAQDGIDVAKDVDRVTYIHLLFDQHEILETEGLVSESYYPGDTSISGLSDDTRQELYALFPELETDCSSYGHTARPALTPREASLALVV